MSHRRQAENLLAEAARYPRSHGTAAEWAVRDALLGVGHAILAALERDEVHAILAALERDEVSEEMPESARNPAVGPTETK